MVQKFLEQYKHPRRLFSPAKRFRIRAFRDKSDQGLTSDFQETFERRIESIPSFLLLGSGSAFGSNPVRDECRCFLDTGRDSISLALLSGEPEEAFPPAVLTRFPRAIFADLRVLKNTTWMRWWLGDRRRFRNEMLRVVSNILTARTGVSVTYEELRQRDRARSLQRWVTSACVTAVTVLGFVAYYASTPQFAWRYTQLGQTIVSSVRHVLKADGTSSIFTVSEQAEPWIDGAGHEGDDTAVTINELTEDGRSIGDLKFSVTDTGDFFGLDSASGSLASLDEEELGALKQRLGYGNASEASDEASDADEGRFELPGEVAISPRNAVLWEIEGADGVAFYGAAEVFDAYNPFTGGLYRTIDFGKTWLAVKPISDVAGWNTLAAVGANRGNPNEIVAALRSAQAKRWFGELVSEARLGGVWITRDNGEHWQALGLANRVVADLIVASSDQIFARILNGDIQSDGYVLVYKRRAALDRLLGRYDLQ